MNYPVVLHKDKDSDYGVTVPDLPGCFSAGRTVDEALAMAREAVELHLEGLVAEGLPVPDPSPIDALRGRSEFRGGVWALVSAERPRVRRRARRINITMPSRVLDAVDRFAREHRETRSGLLAKAAAVYVGRVPSARGRRRGR